jgi:hypothetical protein
MAAQQSPPFAGTPRSSPLNADADTVPRPGRLPVFVRLCCAITHEISPLKQAARSQYDAHASTIAPACHLHTLH